MVVVEWVSGQLGRLKEAATGPCDPWAKEGHPGHLENQALFVSLAIYGVQVTSFAL